MYYQQKGFRKTFAGVQLTAACAMAIALGTAPIARAQSCYLPPTGTMVAWYPFDETWLTYKGRSHNLATQNAAWAAPLFPLPTPVPGEVAGALNFHGNTYADSPDSIVTNFGPAVSTCDSTPPPPGGDFSTCQGDFSIDVWVNLNVPVPEHAVWTIVDKRGTTPTGAPIGYSLFLYRPGPGSVTLIGVQLADASSYTNYESGDLFTLNANAWHHVAVTINRTTAPLIRFFLDGFLHLNAVPTQADTLQNSAPLRIGANGPFDGPINFFDGALDELQIFNRVLTPGEVHAIWFAGTSGQCKQ
jgi:hypothetical protein